MTNYSINKNSFEPLFLQTKNMIKDFIYENNLKPGDKIPNEEELCNLFKVSRITIRRAISELVNDELLYRNHPKGTFIATPRLKLNFIGEFESFAQEIVSKGFNLKDKILVSKSIRANSDISYILNLPIGKKIYNFLRLRFVENDVICLVDSYINSKICPNLNMNYHKNESLYRVIEKEYGLQIFKAHRTLEPITANQKDEELFEIKKGDPMFLIRSKSFLEDGTVIEYYEAKIRGDRSILALEIERTGINNAFKID